MEKDFNPCEWAHSYFLKELTPEQQLQFEQHLSACDACQQELKELELVWEKLPYTMNVIEPPTGMKSETMNAVFEGSSSAEPKDVEEAVADIRAHTSAAIYPGFRNWGLLTAAGVVLLLGAYLLGDLHGRNEVFEGSNSSQASWTAQKKVMLTPSDSVVSGAVGNVWLLQKKEGVQVVLQVSGLPRTQGDESYQMWMTNAGKRWSCGTFKVDQDGAGILLYMMKIDAKFDSIGVTLEPDAAGKQPRGRNIFGA
jgi:hypothetical protein